MIQTKQTHQWAPGGWLNIKMSSYQCKKYNCGDKTILQSSYLHNGISYTSKMTSLYWIKAQVMYVLFLSLPLAADPIDLAGCNLQVIDPLASTLAQVCHWTLHPHCGSPDTSNFTSKIYATWPTYVHNGGNSKDLYYWSSVQRSCLTGSFSAQMICNTERIHMDYHHHDNSSEEP